MYFLQLQTPASFASSIQELIIALQRTDDPHNLQNLRLHLDRLSAIDPNPEAEPPTWEELEECMQSLHAVVSGLQGFAKVGSPEMLSSCAVFVQHIEPESDMQLLQRRSHRITAIVNYLMNIFSKIAERVPWLIAGIFSTKGYKTLWWFSSRKSGITHENVHFIPK